MTEGNKFLQVVDEEVECARREIGMGEIHFESECVVRRRSGMERNTQMVLRGCNERHWERERMERRRSQAGRERQRERERERERERCVERDV